MKVAVLVPAYNPTQRLVELVHGLAAADFPAIIVINDGSSGACDPIFAEVGRIARTTVLRHSINLGKGAALKTGLNHAWCNLPDHVGVVTVDADGQHLVEDALKVARALTEHPASLVVGARGFDRDVPLRSRVGNSLTKLLFQLLVGQRLTDTQSGLRGIPMALVPSLLKITSNGYEFELGMLLACKFTGRAIIEQPIATVYIEKNASSHFNPLVDSMKIYFVLFRYTLTSLLSAVIDNVVFAVVYLLSSNILASQALARSVSMIFNYAAVRKVVYYSDARAMKTLPKYLLLVFVSGVVSYLLIRGITLLTPLSVIPAKLIAESTVFLANFAIQRDFIFVSEGDRGEIAAE
jgi:glycosyltransferase involved in cell wall biosynthesis